MVVRSHNELPSEQVVPVHACKTHHGQQLLPDGAVSPLLGGQTETSVGNRFFLAVLNVGKLGPYGLGGFVLFQDKLTIRCREGKGWRQRQGLLKSAKGGLLLLPPDERFLSGQVVEGKCKLSITSYNASMVVGNSYKTSPHRGRALSPGVFHIKISHFHTLGLTWRPKNSTLLWTKAHFSSLNFKSNSRKRAITRRRLVQWSSKSLPLDKALSRKPSIIF